MKIDMHLHSKHSKRPSQWVLQKIGCPESFSPPEMLRRLTARLGMDGFTITDHNTIDGCLEIAHMPGTFISEEVTTYFPEDGCKLHVLVYNINENIHGDIQHIRRNVYDLVGYLTQHEILHAIAHPLYAVNNKLSLEHFEKLLLLFKVFEHNGARNHDQNQLLQAVLDSLDRETIAELADKHDLEPSHLEPWNKSVIGGSDDHGSLNVTRMHTEAPRAANLSQFFDDMRRGRTEPKGEGSLPETIAHNLYAIAYQYYANRFRLDRYAGGDLMKRFLDRMLRPGKSSTPGLVERLIGVWGQARRHYRRRNEKITDVIRREGERLIAKDQDLREIVRGGDIPGEMPEQRWFRFSERVSSQALSHFGKKILDQGQRGNIFKIFNSIGGAGSLALFMGPYLISYGLFGRDRFINRALRERFLGQVEPDPIKVAHFTDTFYDVNGVAITLQQQARQAAKQGLDLTMVTCSPTKPDAEQCVKNFDPVSVYEMPEYEEQKLYMPPFLNMLRYVHQEGFTHLHAATPGFVGLAALGIARILQLPISGTYHTQIPQYAHYLTNDQTIEEITWRYTLWYYDQMNRIYVPSDETGQELIDRGIDAKKIMLYPRGVNVEMFNPARRNGFYKDRYGLGDQLKLLYVGRVSKEKDLPVLVDAFKRVAKDMPRLQLVVVGDGPYLEQMQRELRGAPAVFTGYLHDEDLAEAYASADLFIFPSTTDTFGNVILEAQASGLPVIVTDQGGPRENIIHGETGLIVPGGDAMALARAMAELCGNHQRRQAMAAAAREYSQTRSFEAAFMRQWNLYSTEKAA